MRKGSSCVSEVEWQVDRLELVHGLLQCSVQFIWLHLFLNLYPNLLGAL